jgi:hypothetical protein
VWRLLNVYVAWVLAGTLGLAMLLQLYPQIAFPLAFVIPTWAWLKGRLLPKTVAEGRASRVRWGQRFLAIANLLVLIGVLLPFVAGGAFRHEEWFALSLVGGLAVVPAVPLWIAGFWCIYGAANVPLDADRRPTSGRRIVFLLLAMLVGGALVVGLTRMGVRQWNTTSWQEAVQLRDGSVLTVSRSIEHAAGGDWGRPYKFALQERLSFVDPVNDNRIVWHEPHRIASLVDSIDGRYWVIARRTSCDYSRRDVPFWQAYVFDGIHWIAVSSSEASGFVKPNLVLDSADHDKTAHWRYVTLEMKGLLDASSRVDSLYRTIDFQAGNCP